MKPAPFNFEFVLQTGETALIRPKRNRHPGRTFDHVFRFSAPFAISQNRQKFFRQRNIPFRRNRFRNVGYTPVNAVVVLCVVTGFVDVNHFVFKIDVRPCQREKFSDPKPVYRQITTPTWLLLTPRSTAFSRSSCSFSVKHVTFRPSDFGRIIPSATQSLVSPHS
mgnify:CR=1 FL=1